MAVHHSFPHSHGGRSDESGIEGRPPLRHRFQGRRAGNGNLRCSARRWTKCVQHWQESCTSTCRKCSAAQARHRTSSASDVRDDKALQAARQTIVDSLTAAFGQPGGGKYNINAGGAPMRWPTLRDPLQAASVPMSDPQLNDLAHNIIDYRTQSLRADPQPG